MLKSYDTVLSYLKKQKNRKLNLLLGNGFSVSYDKDIFSYSALYNFIEKIDDPYVKNVFKIVKTQNFEEVMQYLDLTCKLLNAIKTDKKIIVKIKNIRKKLEKSLLDAVKSMHPEHVFTIKDVEREQCAEFLLPYINKEGDIFSTNYDLLLYWVERSSQDLEGKCSDGFGQELLEEDEYYEDIESCDLIWGPNRSWQNIHYLHGTLSIFDQGTDIIKEVYDKQYLLENIKDRINKQEYPIFVASGNSSDKLRIIKHNPYLMACYDSLCNIKGSLVTFGFSFGKSDEHIIKAINSAASMKKRGGEKLWSVYIGVYDKEAEQYINSIKNKFRCKVNLFDAKTVNIWR